MILMIGNTVGLIAVNVCDKYGIDGIVAYDNKITYKRLGYKVFDSIEYVDVESRILLSVHGREIVPESILNKYIYTANVHPFYDKYKGKSPVKRALEDNCREADVTSHKMIATVDEGNILFQEKKIVTGNTEEEIYSELYPLYAKVIKDTMDYFITCDKYQFVLADD